MSIAMSSRVLSAWGEGGGGGGWVWQPFSKRAWDSAAKQDFRISSFCPFVRAMRPWLGRRRHVGESAGWGPWQCKHREGHWWGEGVSQRLWWPSDPDIVGLHRVLAVVEGPL